MDNAVVRVRMSVIRLALTHDRPNKMMVRRPDRLGNTANPVAI